VAVQTVPHPFGAQKNTSPRLPLSQDNCLGDGVNNDEVIT